MKELDIRYSVVSDVVYLKEWLKEDLKWYPISDEKEMEIVASNWIGFSKFQASLTCILENKACAIGTLFLMPYKKVSHLCMFYMIVKKEFRKRGIGNSLLKNLVNLAENYFKLEAMYAEIFENCSIISILEKRGFKKIVEQKNYVKDDGQYMSRLLYQRDFKE